MIKVRLVIAAVLLHKAAETAFRVAAVFPSVTLSIESDLFVEPV
jgi:hypothetical protein